MKTNLIKKWDVFSQAEAVENLGSKRITLTALPLIILILVGTIVIYVQRISIFLTGSQWSNGGLEAITILEDQVLKIIGYLLIIFSFYLVLNFYRNYNDLPVSGLTLINLLLIFVGIIALNDLVKLVCTGLTMEMPRLGKNFTQVYEQIRQLKGFATGLDLLIAAGTKPSFLTRLMEAVNVFNILGFGYLYTQMTKIKKNCLWIVLILVVIFVVVTVAFDSISLTSMISWED